MAKFNRTTGMWSDEPTVAAVNRWVEAMRAGGADEALIRQLVPSAREYYARQAAAAAE
jgi:hypothetical protein